VDFQVLTIFPEMFQPFWETGIIRRALDRRLIQAEALNIRYFTSDRHRTTDDRPYGGGPGMVMKPEPLAEAIRTAKGEHPESRTILMTPQGRMFNQKIARQLSREEGLILICGRYEGVDERISRRFIDDEISIGDYVLTGGELPAMVVMDAVIRLIPDVLGGADSADKDSFSEGFLEHAHYTRPPVFEGDPVPEILLSGNHREIDRWRLEASLVKTVIRRPDLLVSRHVTAAELEILKRCHGHIENILRTQSASGADSSSGDESVG
jgi:tRNA (guanine37-N1)-methyltransferase